jgi:hypothetical protein
MIVVNEGVNVPSFTTFEEQLASTFELDCRWDWTLLGDWRFVLWPPEQPVRPFRG